MSDDMWMILAYVRPPLATAVLDRIHAIPGVTGASFDRVHGFGRGHPDGSRNPEAIIGFAERERIEVAVSSDLVDLVVSAIKEVAGTGSRGDGKILVLPIARAVRISDGEEGIAVLRQRHS